MNNTVEENEEYFCQSYQEKLLLEPPELYGYYYWIEGKEMCCKVASNREKGMEYRILISPKDAEQYMVQDFSVNKEFKIPTDSHGVVTIEARMKNVPDNLIIRKLEITY